ncbi:hypothetical protein [Candidatus Methanoperedens nitratireducens]|uniref:hypothetical protein n=1 Tax=Candidatus Methanoperedens nitratireducens TaxID=1392998 RepID=UPI001177A7B0|nr:hypothetical protein [Candidatus Methanoperedens nitroreducens]
MTVNYCICAKTGAPPLPDAPPKVRQSRIPGGTARPEAWGGDPANCAASRLSIRRRLEAAHVKRLPGFIAII